VSEKFGVNSRRSRKTGHGVDRGNEYGEKRSNVQALHIVTKA
jgi:hypothetical protein